jgi:pyrroline-5-carboxylate reductase
MRIAFIGGGNMARAIAGGLLDSGYAAGDILVAEPVAAQRAAIGEALPGVTVSASNTDVAARADCIVLAVKPQTVAAVCRELAATVQSAAPLVVSIAAGVRSSDIDAWLGGNLAVVRVMPNQPALLRLGVAAIYANQNTDAGQLQTASDIMSAVGSVVHVPDEADIDAVTAISGSGPAYFFLLIDMLANGARELGLADEVSNVLAIETASGAAALAASSGATMDELIARVRSPGGTTAAALDSLEQQGVRAIFARALIAARDRARSLADEAGK